MSYMPGAGCLAAAAAAAGTGRVTESEVLAAFERVDNYRKTLEASGQVTGKAGKLLRFAEQEAERAQIAAAMQKRHAAINIIKRKGIDAHVDGLINAGVRYDKSMLALLEGTAKGVQNARKSLAANVEAYDTRYTGMMMAELERDHPHVERLLGDEKFDRDVTVEMSELRENGKPGKTGNADAKNVARILAKYSELGRTDANRLGASIGKLDGRFGVQTHDDLKMIHAGKNAWVGFVTAHLDAQRTFPDGVTGEEMAKALGDIYDTIITGISNGGPEPSGRVNPANLAKSLGKSRVLHFNSVDDAMAYRDAFGYGNTISGVLAELRRFAKVNGAMETLGPNPEVMFASVAKNLGQRMKADPRLTDKQKTKIEGRLNTQHGTLRHALDIATGLNSRPVNVTMAKVGGDIRAQQGMAKLGGALITSLGGDTVTAAAASQFRGSGFLKGFMSQWAGIMRGRPRGEQAEIAYMVGEGFDGLIGHIVNNAYAVDGPIGHMAKWQERFFKWNGLTWWTDVNRGVAGRTLAADMGKAIGKDWSDIRPQLRHVLTMNGITETHWGVLQKAGVRQANGKPYLTPDRIADLPAEDLLPLVHPDRLTAVTKLKGDAQAAYMTGVIGDARRQLQLDLLRFYADETSQAIITPDARSRRTTTLGTRPGTLIGEATRLVMQFKSFPIAFTQRIGGRALFGQRKDVSVWEKYGHIGSILAGLTVAGYASMTAKDILKGYWPPRDPSDWRTLMAAMQQGGAWGIYGDYLFSAKSRFGGDLLSTAIGPAIGNFFELGQVALNARDYAAGKLEGNSDAKFSTAQAFSTLWGNVPYANLFYVKQALDYVFVNSIREWASKGYLARQQRQRQRDYGQSSYAPQGPTLAGDMAP